MAERRDFGYIRKLPSGRYQASFTGPDLARHKAPVTFEVKDSAIIWLHNEKKLMEQAATDNERWLSPVERAEAARRQAEPGELFGEYATRWIDERRNSKGEPLRALTQKDYRQVLATYLEPTFGRRAIDRPPVADRDLLDEPGVEPGTANRGRRRLRATASTERDGTGARGWRS